MSETPDAVIVGAALNGLAAALALGGRRCGGRCASSWSMPRIRAASRRGFDGRASAITARARRMFEALGVWQAFPAHAQAMREIIVTDARPRRRRGRLSCISAKTEMQGSPSAHMVENRHLYGALLDEALASPAIRFAVGQPVTSFRFAPGLAEIASPMARPTQGQADRGRRWPNSAARQAAGIELVGLGLRPDGDRGDRRA